MVIHPHYFGITITNNRDTGDTSKPAWEAFMAQVTCSRNHEVSKHHKHDNVIMCFTLQLAHTCSVRSFFHRPTACSGRVMLKALGRFPTKTFNERGFPSLLYVITGGQCNHEIAWVLTISSALIWGRWAGGLINVSTLGSEQMDCLSMWVYVYT